MSDGFDPYHKWLAIPPEEQPANHYRLLGVRLFEDDPDVIETSADRQMGHVRRFATGQRGELSQKILNEISAAKVCLLNPSKRSAYDAALKAKQPAQVLPTAQALPTAQVLPTAQALPQARSANPQLRTRHDHATTAELDIPIVPDNAPAGSTLTRRKKKSSPVVAIAGLVAGAVVIIIIAAVVLKKPAPEIAEVPAQPPTPVRPDPITPDRPIQKVRPAEIPDRSDLNIDQEKTDSGDSPVTVVASGGGSQRLESGKPFSLLSNFDLQENVIAGEGWQLDNYTLTMPASDHSRVQSQVDFPEEYMVTMLVERLSGNAGFYLGLPFGDGEISASIDNTHHDPNNVAAGFFLYNGGDLSVTRNGPRLLVNQPVQVMCVVRRDLVQLMISNKQVASWKPDGRELPHSEYWKVRDPHRLLIGGYRSSFKISRPVVVPIEPRKVAGGTSSSGNPTAVVEGSPIDLLANLDVNRDVIAGKPWTLEDGVLTNGLFQYSHLQFPVEVPEEYTLSLVAKRISGEQHMLMGLPTSVGPVYAVLDMTKDQPGNAPATGFIYFDTEMVEDYRQNFRSLNPNFPVRVRCTVRKSEIRVEVNGQAVKTFTLPSVQTKQLDRWSAPKDDRLVLGAYQSVFNFSQVELRPLQAATIASTQSGTGTVTSGNSKLYGKPVDLLTNLDLEKSVVGGQPWRLEDGVLNVPSAGTDPAVRLQFPNDMPREYVLSMVVERVSEDGHLTLGLPCTSGYIYCTTDMTFKQPNGRLTTGFFGGNNDVHLASRVVGARFLPLDKPVQVELQIMDESLTLAVNGSLLVRWKPDARKYGQSSYWSVPVDNRLMLGSFQGGFKISRLEYKPIETVTIASNSDGPDPEKIVKEFGDPLQEGDSSKPDPEGPITNNPGTGSSRPLEVVAKQDPPSEEKQKETLAVVKDLFPEAYAAAKNPSTKLELGKKLLDTARSTRDDPVALYVLLTEALNYAAESGNAEVPMQALTMLERAFNMDIIGFTSDAFNKIQRGARQNEEHQSILRQIRLPIAAAVQADRYDEADKLLKVALSSARALKDSAIIKEVTAGSKLLRDAQATYEKAKPAKEKLATTPDDPTANTEWGRYLCLVKNNFADGLPLLAKGGDAKLQAAAKADLANPKDGKDQVAVGDKWYFLADDAADMEETILRLRAEYWYRKGLNDINGLEKTRIDKRLKDIAEIDRSNVPEPSSGGSLLTDGQYGPPNMIGYCVYQNAPLPILFTYRQGETADGAAIRNFLTTAGVPSDGNIQITLGGAVELPRETRIGVHLVGGSSNGGVITLYYDDRRSVSVGDDRFKDYRSTRTLSAGVHLISVQIVGGDIGSFMLECRNEDTGEEIPLKTEVGNVNLQKYPVKRKVDMTSLPK